MWKVSPIVKAYTNDLGLYICEPHVQTMIFGEDEVGVLEPVVYLFNL